MTNGRTERNMTRTSTLRSTLALLRARFVADERGATAIEYASMAAGIAVPVASTVFGVGSELKTNFYDKIAALL
jgi:pilus assembly protein Flp/PilA